MPNKTTTFDNTGDTAIVAYVCHKTSKRINYIQENTYRTSKSDTYAILILFLAKPSAAQVSWPD